MRDRPDLGETLRERRRALGLHLKLAPGASRTIEIDHAAPDSAGPDRAAPASAGPTP